MDDSKIRLSRVANVRMLNNYRRLRNVRRTNNLPTLHEEDVAQHSFYVAILATTLAEDYNYSVMHHNLNFHPADVDNTFDTVDVRDVTRKALFHDMEEAFTSDIPWNVKHHNEETHAAIQQCVQDKLNSVFVGTSGSVSFHKETILYAKVGLPGKFVNAADNLEGAWYCYTELEMGNRYMRDLFRKYLSVIRNDPFTQLLWKFSPLFVEIMRVFEKKESELSTSNFDPWTRMILE